MLFKQNKTFDIVKWSVIIGLPAFAQLYLGIASIVGWPYGQEVVDITDKLCLFLGVILGISNYQYCRNRWKSLKNRKSMNLRITKMEV